MTAKEFIIKTHTEETYYDEHLRMMEDYARLKTLEKLKQMSEDYPDHYGLYQVLDREISTLENKANYENGERQF